MCWVSVCKRICVEAAFEDAFSWYIVWGNACGCLGSV